MFNIGPAELLVVLVIALLVLGPNKLPDAARQVGRAIGEMRKLSSGFQAEMRDALKEPVEGKPTASSSRSALSSKSSEAPAADDTATGGSLSAPRPSATEATVATSALAVGDESGFIASGDGGASGSVVDAEAHTPATNVAADTGAGDETEVPPPGLATTRPGTPGGAEPAGVEPEGQPGPSGTTAP